MALTWCFEDERTAGTEELLKRVVESGAVVPVLWPLEVLNALAMAERRCHLDRDTRHRLAQGRGCDSCAAAWEMSTKCGASEAMRPMARHMSFSVSGLISRPAGEECSVGLLSR